MHKKILIILGLLTLSGCATHGVVTIPVQSAVENADFVNKTISTKLYYSQPKPGIFSGGEVLPMKPISEAELSVGSSRVLARYKELLSRQLPMNTKVAPENSNGDFLFITELQAKDKAGPSYADYDMALSTGKKLLTLGLGSSEYTIIADFDVTYKLLNHDGKLLLQDTYTVYDEVDHERGGFDGFDIGDDLAAKLLEKNIIITMHKFFLKTGEMKIN
ncbi:TPA: hypothetical protein ACX6QD_003092 [Photobacterium damselae]